MTVPAHGLADLFITDRLDERPAVPADYRREMLAVQDLATRMVDDPEGVLPRFVDLALEITGAISGGLSLYEETPAPGVFRWHFLRGTLAGFNGATTPRDFSPCGITLDRNGPVLTLHPERVYDWLVTANVELPEVLLVPLYLGGTQPLGTLWVVSETEDHFTRDHARALGELAAFVGIAVRMTAGEKSLKQALSAQEVLTKEMSHRVNNVFAVTDGMIRMTAKNAANKDELAQSLSGRLHALAGAHSLASRKIHEPDEPQQPGDVGGLIRAVVSPHDGLAASGVQLDGPPTPCGDHAMTGLALIFHELATNSAKYGAIGADDGVVDIQWSLDGDELSLSWTESGGPPVIEPPKQSGFGSVLIRGTVVSQFGGSLMYEWPSTGLRVAIRLPLNRLVL